MECIFCKSEQAVHLDPAMPLCQQCVEVRDFMRDWGENKEEHGQSLDEFVQTILHEANITLPSPSATVH